MVKTICEVIMWSGCILLFILVLIDCTIDTVRKIKNIKNKKKLKFDKLVDTSKYMQKNIIQEEKKVITISGTTRLMRIKGIANLHLAEEELARAIADELIKNELISLNTMCSHEEDCILVRGSIEVIDHRGEAHEA